MEKLLRERIAKNIRSLRERANLTQKEVAELCGVSLRAVSNWENIGALPCFSTMIQLGKLYGINPYDICVQDHVCVKRTRLLELRETIK